MENFDWTTFTLRIPVKSTLEKLYWCWSTREGLEYWFLRKSEFKTPEGVLKKNSDYVQKGDTYTWLWYGWDDDTVETGTILECNGKDSMAFSFGKAGDCVVSIKPEAGQFLVELTQVKIPDDEHGKQYWHIGCRTGWTFYLGNLKSLLEGGIDLRNRDVAIRNVVNS